MPSGNGNNVSRRGDSGLPQSKVAFSELSDQRWEKVWYFVSKINCYSDWEKLLKFEAENLQNVWDHMTNLFKQWKVRTVFGNRMLF